MISSIGILVSLDSIICFLVVRSLYIFIGSPSLVYSSILFNKVTSLVFKASLSFSKFLIELVYSSIFCLIISNEPICSILVVIDFIRDFTTVSLLVKSLLSSEYSPIADSILPTYFFLSCGVSVPNPLLVADTLDRVI